MPGGSAVAIDDDGRIVAVGAYFDGVSIHTAVARFGADGSLDSSFGNGGIQTLGLYLAQYLEWPEIAVQPDGSVLTFTGIGDGVSNPVSVLTRLTPSGVLDEAFGNRGIVTFDRNFIPSAIAVRPDGTILVAGTAIGSHSPDTGRLTQETSPYLTPAGRNSTDSTTTSVRTIPQPETLPPIC